MIFVDTWTYYILCIYIYIYLVSRGFNQEHLLSTYPQVSTALNNGWAMQESKSWFHCFISDIIAKCVTRSTLWWLVWLEHPEAEWSWKILGSKKPWRKVAKLSKPQTGFHFHFLISFPFDPSILWLDVSKVLSLEDFSSQQLGQHLCRLMWQERIRKPWTFVSSSFPSMSIPFTFQTSEQFFAPSGMADISF